MTAIEERIAGRQLLKLLRARESAQPPAVRRRLGVSVRASLAGTGELREQPVRQWMAVRAGPDRIDGPSCRVAPDGGGGDSLEAPGEQAAGERHGEPGRDELSEREDVAGHEGDVRLESGR